MQSMSDLPDDIEILKQIVIEQRGRLLSNTLQIEQLKLQLAKLRRMQFGRSSEQIDPEVYLRYVLTHIADHPVNGVHELLPWNLTAQVNRQRIAA
jgi:hypothetical protein